jgi:putative glutamine amidotransferase
MSRRPVIGICAAIEHAAWTVWRGVEVNISPRTYSRGISEAGGLPLLLPVHDAGAGAPDQLLELLDAVLLSGGSDLDPASYGADADPLTTGYSAERDRFELALARGAVDRDLPVLGICRGMEVLNVARGGTLQQHLADATTHLHTPGSFADHEVRLEPGSLAARALGAERGAVRSHHHQGVATLGEGLVASGWAEPGGAIEAIEIPERRWVLGILWHAEEEPMSPVLASLTAAAREQEVRA